MPLVKRRYRIPCRGEECLKLYELVKERVPSIEHVEFAVTSNGLIVDAYGYETDLKKLWIELKNYSRMAKGVSGPGLQAFSIDVIVKLTRKTFPPEVLVKILEKQGYKARLEDGTIYTNIEKNRILELVERISELNTAIRGRVKGTAARYFIITVTIITGLQLDDAINHAVEAGLLGVDESGLYVLKHEWRDAVDLFIKSFKQQNE
ncbi:DUF2067 family protein [Desulfurococcus amylolyticus]|uniref:DUF2067 domain-containing protein n=1 Tax=Desulfurococcus amylolyticus (strain DSM 18924 / JCM 16383 / VKM B-2413 / 1221n) TaxID=490899 RepID=B8D6L0_DESA1|nr:DUF2067 family protein [Desulfurococcus amylolyticus]ACL11741.1 hypothetical protein DKAM_1415 [Desulfurococcus amylolyticus 1221n]